MVYSTVTKSPLDKNESSGIVIIIPELLYSSETLFITSAEPSSGASLSTALTAGDS